jgi:O-antigen/teichoic acid export membrane protein
MVRIGGLTTATQLVTYLAVNSGPVLIGKLGSSAMTGIFARSYSLAFMPLQQLSSPITRAVVPTLSRLPTREAFVRCAMAGQAAVSFIVGSAMALIGALAPAVIALLLGPQWGPSIPVVEMLCLAGIFTANSYAQYWACLAKARMRLLLVTELPGRIVWIGLTIAWASQGPQKVALAYAIGAFIVFATGQLLALPRLGVGWRSIGTLLGSITAAQVLVFACARGAVALAGVPAASIAALAIGCVAGVIGLAALWLVPPVRRHMHDAVRFLREPADSAWDA